MRGGMPALACLLCLSIGAVFSCHRDQKETGVGGGRRSAEVDKMNLFGSPRLDSRFTEARHRMVADQLRGRDITDERVLEAMARVPRHLFVPEDQREFAYDDRALPLSSDQTISQPYIVGLMTQLGHPAADMRALEIGTGSGYQAAVLGELVREVFTIEIIPELAKSATERLKAMGHKNVHARCGDGYQGWPEKAPFDLILVTAAPDHIPPALVNQLAPRGRLVIPLGD